MRTPSSWLRTCESQKLDSDTARLEERMRDSCHEFTCERCGKEFYIPIEDYRGQWDHGGEPVCPECREDEE